MRFRSSERRRQARQRTADRAASKLIKRFMKDQQNRYLTYHLSFLERCQFKSHGETGTYPYFIEERVRRFEDRVARSLRAKGINVETSLDFDIQSHRLKPDAKYLRSCTLTVQCA